jgi:hypothetical protein
MWLAWTCLVIVLASTSFTVAHARPSRPNEVDAVLETIRAHHRALEEAVPRYERDVQAAMKSVDRRAELYARGLIPREELTAAAREAAEARARLDEARGQLARATAFLAEMDAERQVARLPPLRPGQLDARDGFLRYAGTRRFTPGDMGMLERHFSERIGRPLPVSAAGQTDLHTRLGLDHRDAVDLAVHPDSVEGRLVIAWLRAEGISFLAFRGARAGMATGAHIHVGPPSARIGRLEHAAPASREGVAGATR